MMGSYYDRTVYVLVLSLGHSQSAQVGQTLEQVRRQSCELSATQMPAADTRLMQIKGM